jgi:hypothetical protein
MSVLVSYQMSSSNGRLIFPRDFVLAVKFGEKQTNTMVVFVE